MNGQDYVERELDRLERDVDVLRTTRVTRDEHGKDVERLRRDIDDLRDVMRSVNSKAWTGIVLPILTFAFYWLIQQGINH